MLTELHLKKNLNRVGNRLFYYKLSFLLNFPDNFLILIDLLIIYYVCESNFGSDLKLLFYSLNQRTLNYQ